MRSGCGSLRRDCQAVLSVGGRQVGEAGEEVGERACVHVFPDRDVGPGSGLRDGAGQGGEGLDIDEGDDVGVV